MRPRRLRSIALTLATATAALAAVALSAPGSAGAAPEVTVQVPQRACSTAAPGRMACHAIRLLTKRVSSAEAARLTAHGLARPAVVRHVAFGPAGGYSPGQLAKAYGLNTGAATTQTVAIVDAFDDPSVRADLNTFDDQYGLPHETAGSFRVVNQNGNASPLPTPDSGWAAEITLDVQTVRGLCHKCKILLVEANSNFNSDLGTAVNRAVTMGAKIVSNSYGGPEGVDDPTFRSAFNHPGVAILASTGDDGWYGWDWSNQGAPSDDAPSTPASYNTVVGVGGTSLYVNPDSSYAAESVWNDNGPADDYGNALNERLGAAGSGCSTLYGPQLWQKKVAGYSTLGCGTTKRNGVDIAAEADYFTGYDIYQTFGNVCTPPDCWYTIGGTSLASPLVAAMWGLAGGPAGVKYPALTLYGHYKSDAAHLHDIKVGSTGMCGGTSPRFCTGGSNPNVGALGMLDCAWGPSGSTVLANRYQCYAKPGYDGVSGVGTPKGTAPFKPMSPRAVIKSPGTVTHGVSHTFSASGSSSPFPGGTITKYVWNWGDGHSTTTTHVTASHTYSGAGKRTITLTVSDNYTAQNHGRTGKKSLTITVK